MTSQESQPEVVETGASQEPEEMEVLPLEKAKLKASENCRDCDQAEQGSAQKQEMSSHQRHGI